MRPRKNRAGNRAYRPREIQYIHYIRHLLHEEKYTLQGAKKKLGEVSFEEVAGQTTLLRVPAAAQPAARDPAAAEASTSETPVGVPGLTPEQRKELQAIRDGLKDVLKLLDK
jgi:DNA-binding transcriptional MerR regulator